MIEICIGDVSSLIPRDVVDHVEGNPRIRKQARVVKATVKPMTVIRGQQRGMSI